MRTALLTCVVLPVLLLASVASAQRTPAPALPTLPPLSMSCVHHPDVLQDGPGSCPFCSMALVPVRLDASWMCPLHTTVVEQGQGTCRLCGRTLVPVTVNLTWTCRADDEVHLEPGVCADGSPRIGQRTLRPHGNHNPRHGGQFFMAPDNWHHVEGTYPSRRAFRLYLYDDYGRPLPPVDLREVRARVVTQETFDPATRVTTELVSFPLRASTDSSYLEAQVDEHVFPTEMTAKVNFGGGSSEYRFDFFFDTVTAEPTEPTLQSAIVVDPALATDTGLPTQALPDSMAAIVDLMDVRNREVAALIARGDFAAVWVPAFQAKDLAIALEPHLTRLTEARRERGEPALGRVVQAAWLLDASGDVGNRQQVESAYAAFTAAIADVIATFR